MTDLSPAAQAVLDAAMQYEINPECYSREIAAAALRAAADEVVPEDYNPPRTAFCPEAGAFVDGKECRNEDVRYQLLAIAAELEGVTSR
jgi:hypothetical protein